MRQTHHETNQADIAAKAAQQRPHAPCRTCSYWLGNSLSLQAYCAQHGRNMPPSASCTLHTVL